MQLIYKKNNKKYTLEELAEKYRSIWVDLFNSEYRFAEGRYCIDDVIIENVEKISSKRRMSDYIILRLRLLDGVNKLKFKKDFGLDFDNLYGDRVEKLVKDGFVTNDECSIKLTTLGLDFANLVFIEFLD